MRLALRFWFVTASATTMTLGQDRDPGDIQIETKLNRLVIGQRSSVVAKAVPGYANFKALLDYNKALLSKDKEGEQELVAAKQLIAISANTQVRILELNNDPLDIFYSAVKRELDRSGNEYRECLNRKGPLPARCPTQTMEVTINKVLKDRTIEQIIDDTCLALVRILSGPHAKEKYWVAYGSLIQPSKPE